VHAKAGTALATVVFVGHLIAFALLFRQQGPMEIHPPDQDVSIISPSLSSNHTLTPKNPSPLSESPNKNLGQTVTTVDSGILATTSTSPFTTPSHTTNVPRDTIDPSSPPASHPST